MKKVIAVLVAAVLAVGGVSFANAYGGEPGYTRPAPAGPDPDKKVTTHQGGTVTARSASGAVIEADVPQGIAGGYVYVPVNPYRTYDSRAYDDGYLLAGDAVYFDVLTDEAGNPMIPSTAVAVTYNLTVTGTSGGGGWLALYPANIDWPNNSSINWTSDGTTLANGGTVAIGFLTAAGQLEILHGPGGRVGGTEVIVDITGYYL